MLNPSGLQGLLTYRVQLNIQPAKQHCSEMGDIVSSLTSTEHASCMTRVPARRR